MPGLADDLRSTLASESIRLLAISDDAAAIRPSPGKWSPKEVVGHLIDSATNNHGRFVRAQLSDDMVFEGYEQDGWVRVQHYNDRAWMDLVSLWRAMNTHIAGVVERISPDSLSRQRTRHNLDQVGWNTVPRDQPVTLEYFVRDYIAHLKHHLGQIS